MGVDETQWWGSYYEWMCTREKGRPRNGSSAAQVADREARTGLSLYATYNQKLNIRLIQSTTGRPQQLVLFFPVICFFPV
jgi:hypothetical protein